MTNNKILNLILYIRIFVHPLIRQSDIRSFVYSIIRLFGSTDQRINELTDQRIIGIWILSFVIGICFLASQSYSAEVYKWTDEKGVVHFSDSPPNKDYQEIYLEESPSVEVEQKSTQIEEMPKEEKTKEEEKEKKKKVNPLTNNPLISGVDNNGNDRNWWQGKKKWWLNKERELVEKINEERKNLNVLRGRARVRQTEIDPSTGQRVVHPDIMGSRLRGARRQTIRDLEKELEHARYMLSIGLKEEARKAEAPVGWVD